MHSLTQMIGAGFHAGAPSHEAEQIDAQIADQLPCPRCGGPMHYEGYHRQGRAYIEYVALAVCGRCGHKISF